MPMRSGSYPCQQRWQAEPGHTCRGCMTSTGSPCNYGGWVTGQQGAPESPAEANDNTSKSWHLFLDVGSSSPTLSVCGSGMFLVCVFTLWMPSSLTQMLLNKVLKILLSVKAKNRTVLSWRQCAISSKMAAASSWTSSVVLPVSLET